MGNLDIELDSHLVEGMKRLAEHHYGDSGDASIGRVAEAALAMRLLWLDLVKEGGNEIEEAVASWEFPDGQPPAKIRDWLFRRR